MSFGLESFGYYPFGVDPAALLEGSIGLAGTGALVIAASRRTEARAVFAGSGGFATRAYRQLPTRVVMVGVGDFEMTSAPVSVQLSGRVAFNGAGALTPRPIQNTQMRAVLAGAGKLTWPARLIDVVTGGMVKLQGAGGLVVRLPLVDRSAAILFAGDSDLYAGLRLSALVRTGDLDGRGKLTTRTKMTDIIQPGELLIPGQGALTVRTTQQFVNRLSFLGAGSFSTDDTSLRVGGRFIPKGAGALVVRAGVVQPGGIPLIGEGNLAASIDAKLWATRAAFAGAGKLVVRVGRIEEGVLKASFAGRGAFVGQMGSTQKSGEFRFVGAGKLTMRMSVRERAAFWFRGTGDFLPAGLYSLGPAWLRGAGFLRVIAPPLRFAELRWTGTGAMTTRLRTRGALRAGFAGVGAMTTRISRQQPGRAAFAGVGGLTVRVVARERIRVAFQGAGALTAGLTLTFKVRFQGAGLLYTRGVERLRFATVRFQGAGGFYPFRAPLLVAAGSVMAGASNLVVRGRLRLPIAAEFAGQGVMRTFAGIKLGQARFFGVGELTVSDFGGVRRRGVAWLRGTGELLAVTDISRRLATWLRGTGGISVQPGIVRAPNLVVRWVGAGRMVYGGALPTYAYRATGFRFNGAGTMLTRVAFRTVGAFSAMNGVGTLFHRIRLRAETGLEWYGEGNLGTRAGLRLPVARFGLPGEGTLAVDTIQKAASPVHLAGAGEMYLRIGPPILWIVIPGQGKLVAETWGSIIQAGSHHLAGAGLWAPDIPVQSAAAVHLAGDGTLSVLRSPVRYRAAVELEGVGDLYMSEVNRYPISPRFFGEGVLRIGPELRARGRAVLAGQGALGIDPDVLTTLLSRAELKGTGGLQIAPVREAMGRVNFAGQSFLHWSDTKLFAISPWFRGAGKLTVQSGTPTMGINPVFEGAGTLRVNARVYRWIGDAVMAGEGNLTLADMGQFWTARFRASFEGEGVLHPVELLRRYYQPGEPPRTLYTPRAPSGRILKTARRTGTR